MEEITRITTEYVETEDRIRLSGQTPAGATVILWVPERLLSRLVPLLCERIEPGSTGNPRDEALNAFAQMAAVQELTPLPPVALSRESSTHTVRAVTIVTGHQVVQLVLKEHDTIKGREFSLVLRHGELRQWLAILHRQWVRAQWREGIWPSWVVEAQTAPATRSALSH